MIRQRLLFAGLMVAVVGVVASSGDVEARNCRRCQGQRGWRQGNGYTQASYNYGTVQTGQPMTSPTPAGMPPANPGTNPPAPPEQAPQPAPAPASQPSPAPAT